MLVEKLAAIPGIKDIGLTTNGILLAPLAQVLWNAGLRRINVSLDTLDPERFQQLTRRPGLEQVIEGILAAKAAGFDPVKVNAVAMRGRPRKTLCRWPGSRGARPRTAVHRVHAAGWRIVGARKGALRRPRSSIALTREIGPLVPAPDQDPRAPAIDYDYVDGGGRIGIIASVSRPFCMSCNRVRLTSDGKLRNCLFSLEETDIRGLLRGGAGDEEIVRGDP